MKKLFELLEKHTSEKGSFMLMFNDFKTYYKTAREEFDENYDEYELEGVDLSKSIYHLVWYKRTPVGSYDFIANDLEALYDKVKKQLEGGELE